MFNFKDSLCCRDPCYDYKTGYSGFLFLIFFYLPQKIFLEICFNYYIKLSGKVSFIEKNSSIICGIVLYCYSGFRQAISYITHLTFLILHLYLWLSIYIIQIKLLYSQPHTHLSIHIFSQNYILDFHLPQSEEHNPFSRHFYLSHSLLQFKNKQNKTKKQDQQNMHTTTTMSILG